MSDSISLSAIVPQSHWIVLKVTTPKVRKNKRRVVYRYILEWPGALFLRSSATAYMFSYEYTSRHAQSTVYKMTT
jgi:hypothetical protein